MTCCHPEKLPFASAFLLTTGCHPECSRGICSFFSDAGLDYANHSELRNTARIGTQTVTTDLNRTAIERSLRWRIYALGFGSLLFSILLALASSHALISLRALRISLFVSVAVATAAYLALILNARKNLRASAPDFTKPPDTNEQVHLRHRIRRLESRVVILVFALLIGVWQSHEIPRAMLAVGVALNLLFQVYLGRTILRLKRRLNFEAGQSLVP
jgi:hypothetical protein